MHLDEGFGGGSRGMLWRGCREVSRLLKELMGKELGGLC